MNDHDLKQAQRDFDCGRRQLIVEARPDGTFFRLIDNETGIRWEDV